MTCDRARIGPVRAGLSVGRQLGTLGGWLEKKGSNCSTFCAGDVLGPSRKNVSH